MAGWFKFLFCYFLFPSFPRGGVLPLPLPPPRALDPSDPGSSRLLFSIFLSSCCPSFFIVFSIPFLMPLGSIFPANLLPQIHQNPSKIDAKMPSHVDFVFYCFLMGFCFQLRPLEPQESSPRCSESTIYQKFAFRNLY